MLRSFGCAASLQGLSVHHMRDRLLAGFVSLFVIWSRLLHPLSPSVFALTMAAALTECRRTGCVAVRTPACEGYALPFVLCCCGLILLV